MYMTTRALIIRQSGLINTTDSQEPDGKPQEQQTHSPFDKWAHSVQTLL